jgi:hypothetical protein
MDEESWKDFGLSPLLAFFVAPLSLGPRLKGGVFSYPAAVWEGI